MNRMDLFNRYNRINWERFKTRLSWLEFRKRVNLRGRWNSLQRWYASFLAEFRLQNRLTKTKIYLMVMIFILLTCIFSLMVSSCVRTVYPDTPATATPTMIMPLVTHTAQPTHTPLLTSTPTTAPPPITK
jgi:hypothetical protein